VIPRRRAARDDDLCDCGHVRDAHEHYRAGDDCGACGATRCPRFRLATTPPAPADEVPPTVDATA
jgi:hypothetical protein